MGEEGGEEGAPGDFPLCVQSWELAPVSASEETTSWGTVRRRERGAPSTQSARPALGSTE